MSENNQDSKKLNVQVENIAEVDLKESENVRVIITETTDGQVTISAKTQGPVNVTYLTGLLEVAKNDILNRQEEESQQESVEVVLDQTDFDMDINGTLTEQGKKIGDAVSMPKQIAELRDAAKIQFARRKDSK